MKRSLIGITVERFLVKVAEKYSLSFPELVKLYEKKLDNKLFEMNFSTIC